MKRIILLLTNLHLLIIVLHSSNLDTIFSKESCSLEARKYTNIISDKYVAVVIDDSTSTSEENHFSMFVHDLDGKIIYETEFNYSSSYGPMYNGATAIYADSNDNFYVCGEFIGDIHIAGVTLHSEPPIKYDYRTFSLTKQLNEFIYPYSGYIMKFSKEDGLEWVIKTPDTVLGISFDNDNNVCVLQKSMMIRLSLYGAVYSTINQTISAMKIDSNGVVLNEYHPEENDSFVELFYSWDNSGKLYILGYKETWSGVHKIYLAVGNGSYSTMKLLNLNISTNMKNKQIYTAYFDDSGDLKFNIDEGPIVRAPTKENLYVKISGKKLFPPYPVSFTYNIKSGKLTHHLNLGNSYKANFIYKVGDYVVESNRYITSEQNYPVSTFKKLKEWSDFRKFTPDKEVKRKVIKNLDGVEIANLVVEGDIEIYSIHKIKGGLYITGACGDTTIVNNSKIIVDKEKPYIEMIIDNNGNLKHLAKLKYFYRNATNNNSYFKMFGRKYMIEGGNHAFIPQILLPEKGTVEFNTPIKYNIHKVKLPTNPEGNVLDMT